MNKVVFFIFLIQITTFSGNLFGINVYKTEFHHVEIVTDNVYRTKSETIKKIKIKSFTIR